MKKTDVGLRALLIVFFGSVLAADDQAAGRPSSRTEWTVAPIVSFQPGAFEGESGGPYLDFALGGTAPGLLIGAQKRLSTATVGLELSSTLPFSTRQGGRYIYGSACQPSVGPPSPDCHTVLSKGRDTVLSMLLGTRGKAVTLRGGLSFLLTHVKQGDGYEGSLGAGFVLGLDGSIPAGRTNLVAILRYTRAFRTEGVDEYAGMGRNILRVGLGLRFGGS